MDCNNMFLHCGDWVWRVKEARVLPYNGKCLMADNNEIPVERRVELVVETMAYNSIHNYRPSWNSFSIKKVIFSPPATIIIWSDDTKTVVKCGPNDYYDPEKGLALCFMKRAFGNDNNKFHKVFNKALKDGSMKGYFPFPMTPVEFDAFYEEYLKLKEGEKGESDAG